MSKTIVAQTIHEDNPNLIISSLGNLEKLKSVLELSEKQSPCLLFKSNLDCSDLDCDKCKFHKKTGASVASILKWIESKNPKKEEPIKKEDLIIVPKDLKPTLENANQYYKPGAKIKALTNPKKMNIIKTIDSISPLGNIIATTIEENNWFIYNKELGWAVIVK